MQRQSAWFILISFSILPVFLSAANFGHSAQERPQKRTITVCVLNDTTTRFLSGSKTFEIPPIPREKIEKVVSEASGEYDANANILFKIAEYHDIKINIKPIPTIQTAELRLACMQGEIAAVFTNQQMVIWSESAPIYGQKKTISLPRIWDGWSDVDYGIVWIFGVEFRDIAKRESGPAQTLKHEIGHLFNLEHSPEPTDFMYEKGMSAAWSDHIRDGIKNNFNIRWKMKP